jgi:hypothetical protein
MDLGTALCGVYTIGGTNPDFTNFTDAAAALNGAGITCPVVFKVRNGVYNEQIKLYEILGSSAVNTITFEGESGDSTLAELHYQTSNPSNDFTLQLIGTDYVTFKKMGIRRTNGTGNMFIQNVAHHITVQNCRLGHVTSPNTSCDSVLTFRYNNMQGFDLNLQHPDNTKAGAITIENNFVNSVVVNNAGPVSIKNNRNNADVNSYAVDFTVDKSTNVTVQNNRMRRLYMTTDKTIDVSNNNLYDVSNQCCDIRGILLNECNNANVLNNNILNYTHANTRGIDVLNSKNVLVTGNRIEVRNNATWNGYWSMGVYIEGGNTRKVYIKNNTIINNSGGTDYGIYMDAGDSIYIKNNTIDAPDLSTSFF